ncbi:MAG: hypothetical protein IPO81_22345 [Kouleothrix sp.]|nr:hypothetical protein [Kouleothrix sp.]
MTMSRPGKQRASGAPGLKALITATSLAVTLGGWAILSSTQATPAAGAQPDDMYVEAALANRLDLGLPPVPTIVAPPQRHKGRDARSPAISVPSQAPALRTVSAPPRPIARTRSSR